MAERLTYVRISVMAHWSSRLHKNYDLFDTIPNVHIVFNDTVIAASAVFEHNSAVRELRVIRGSNIFDPTRPNPTQRTKWPIQPNPIHTIVKSWTRNYSPSELNLRHSYQCRWIQWMQFLYFLGFCRFGPTTQPNPRKIIKKNLDPTQSNPAQRVGWPWTTLREVLESIARVSTKCGFNRPKVQHNVPILSYLDHILSPGVVRPDLDKVCAVIDNRHVLYTSADRKALL